MANATITVLEADGVTQTDVVTLDVGRQAAAASKSVAMATEDKTVLDAVAASLVTIDGRVDGLETLITSTNTKLDTAITALQIIDNMVLAAGSARVGTVGLNDGTNAITFAQNTPSTNDYAMPVIMHTDSQNANGSASAANSAPVTASTEDVARIGIITETAPASDTASSGLNGRLQRVAQNLTTAITSLQLLDDAVVADDAAFTPATTKVHMAGFQADEASTDSVDEGDGGAARMTLDRKQIVTMQPHTAGGLSVFRSLDLDETEEEVKGTAGCLYKLRATNRTTSVRYLKLYNATAANTTVGTTTPIDTIPIPANASDYTVLTESFGGLGLTFDTALSVAVTTGFADNDTGAPGANDVIVSAYYK